MSVSIIGLFLVISIITTLPMSSDLSEGERCIDQLLQDIKSAPYETTSYKLNVFDCTDMSAIMEKHLTDCGWDARIQCFVGDGVYGHARVIVYDGNERIPVECTRKSFGFTPPKGMRLVGEYDDIVDAVENSRWGVSEWGLELYLEERE